MGGAPALASQDPPQLDEPLRLDQIPGFGTAHHAGRARQGDAAPGLTINTQDREAVRVFFNGLYSTPEPLINWTGNYATGDAGDINPAYREAQRLRLNWFRAMAGVPANVSFDAANNAEDQQGAMLMSYNNQLSHYPPTSWPHYTAIGADAAGHSSLAQMAGRDAIDSFVREYGAPNGPVGHRRWMLHPQTLAMGSGTVPGATLNGATYSPATALWAADYNAWNARPTVRDDFVAWPPRGFVPYPVVYGRWSFSYPAADFSQAQVAVSSNNAKLGVTIEALATGYGDNTIVWLLQGTTYGSIASKPAADQRYQVTVSNVLVAGQARSFSYEVVVFDPAVPTPGAAIATVQAPASADIGKSFTLGLAPMANATGYNISQYQRQSLGDGTFTALNASGNWTLQTTGSYNPLLGASFQLYHATPADQSMTMNKLLLASTSSTLSLNHSVGWATPDESLHIQLSQDDGQTWVDLYTEKGSSAPSSVAQPLQLSLAPYAGRKFKLRALVTLASGGSYYYDDQSGWRLSDIQLSNVDELINQQSYDVPASAAVTASIAKPGDYILFGRPQYQGLYYGDYGPAAALHMNGALLTGPLSNYTITHSGSTYTIVDNVGKDGSQTVSNPFRLDFSDVSIAYDLDGNAGKAYRLYQAAFNRQPDLSGLGFWIKALDGGLSLNGMAAGFTASPEYQGLYGSAPGKDQLIKAAYSNVLHRSPETDGYNFWMSALNNGLSKENMLLMFADSPENRAQTAAAIADGIVYIRR